MPFDGFVTAAVCREANGLLSGGRIDKLGQPTSDELVVTVRARDRQSYRLCLSASSNIPKAHITGKEKSNPAVPSALCMQLRSHLLGAHIKGVSQPDFDRVVKIELQGSDDMGFARSEALIAEVMGKCSNVVLVNLDTGKTVNALRTTGLDQGAKRILLPGAPYEAPPAQDKCDPTRIGPADFDALIERFGECEAEKFALCCIKGFSPLMSRELAHRANAAGKTAAGSAAALKREFFEIMERTERGDFSPCTVSKDGKLIDYSAFELTHYGEGFEIKHYGAISECIDSFYAERENFERIHRRAGDVLRLCQNAKARIEKKIANQLADLEATKEAEKFRLCGDLITANIWNIKEGVPFVTLDNYYTDGEKVTVALDKRLSAAENAQRYYKKYAKAKNAKKELTARIEISKGELEYINTVSDALGRYETEEDLMQIRAELYESGYASKPKQKSSQKMPKPKPMRFTTLNGYTVLVGKNNMQNDALTMKQSADSDWFFHVKGAAGSHVVMVCDPDDDPPAEDFTDAGILAVYYSSRRGGSGIDVDYTRVKYVKKPPDSPPGFVTYRTNYSMTVTEDAEILKRLGVKP